MEVSLGCYLLYGFGAFLAYICFRYFPLIKNIVETLPRDIYGVKCFVKLQLACRLSKWRNDTVFKTFDSVADKYPDKVCFYFENEAWTFTQVKQFTNKIANYFSYEGYRKGDKIALVMGNRPEFVGIWLGLSKIGVETSLININLRQESLKHALEVLPHKAIIYEEEIIGEVLKEAFSLDFKPKKLFRVQRSSGAPTIKDSIDLGKELEGKPVKFAPEVYEKINFDDPLYYSFTSGTTGFPKAAVIKHSKFFMVSYGTIHVIGVKNEDVLYTPLPLYHTTAGMLGLGSGLINGTSIVLKKKFSASQFWTDCIKYEVTVAQYIGEVCRYLYSQPESEFDRQHKVRKMFGLGLRMALWPDFVKRFGIEDINEFYGATESNCNMVSLDGKAGACGFVPRWMFPFLSYNFVKVDEDGEIIRDKDGWAVTCGFGEPGELIGKIIKGDAMKDFEGYSDKSSTEKKVLRYAFVQGDSYFRTGDLLMMDERGYIYFKDRIGDTFRWKGENCSTQQIEEVISKICDLADVAVYGVEIPGTEGRAGMAAIADADGKLDLVELAREIGKQLPNYARPIFIRKMDKLDFTGTHKLKKAELKNEGFDIGIVQDPIYFLSETKYVPLTKDIFNAIMEGNVRL